MREGTGRAQWMDGIYRCKEWAKVGKMRREKTI